MDTGQAIVLVLEALNELNFQELNGELHAICSNETLAKLLAARDALTKALTN